MDIRSVRFATAQTNVQIGEAIRALIVLAGDLMAMSIRLLVLAVLCAIAFPAAAHAVVPSPRDGEVKMMCKQINSFRAENGIPPMKLSSNLNSAASWMGYDMANKNYFSHTDSLGRSYSTRLLAFGFVGTSVAENIAAGAVDATTTLNMWKSSAPHRANLLNASYNVMGVGRGYNVSSTYDVYWVTDFGTSSAYATAC